MGTGQIRLYAKGVSMRLSLQNTAAIDIFLRYSLIVACSTCRVAGSGDVRCGSNVIECPQPVSCLSGSGQ
jgi:hypothetical protein